MLNWDGLKSVCADCTRCGLCETRHNVVFGVGNEDLVRSLIGGVFMFSPQIVRGVYVIKAAGFAMPDLMGKDNFLFGSGFDLFGINRYPVLRKGSRHNFTHFKVVYLYALLLRSNVEFIKGHLSYRPSFCCFLKRM